MRQKCLFFENNIDTKEKNGKGHQGLCRFSRPRRLFRLVGTPASSREHDHDAHRCCQQNKPKKRMNVRRQPHTESGHVHVAEPRTERRPRRQKPKYSRNDQTDRHCLSGQPHHQNNERSQHEKTEELMHAFSPLSRDDSTQPLSIVLLPETSPKAGPLHNFAFERFLPILQACDLTSIVFIFRAGKPPQV